MPHDQDPQEECATAVLFERWKTGDETAFDSLHARFSPLLKSRIRRHRAWPMLAAKLQVDDVLQEFWARAVPAAKQKFVNLGPGSLLAFFGVVADRVLIDLARRHQAGKRHEGGERSLETSIDVVEPGRPGCSVPETPTSHARATELGDLARAVLNEREYEAWDLVEVQGYSAEEAGLALVISGSAVRGLLLRGRTKLIARMSDPMSE